MHLQKALWRRTGVVEETRIGNWQDAFPNLNSNVAAYGDLPFDTAKILLAQFQSQADKNAKVSVLGLELKSEHLRQFGVFVLLTLQLYFAIHVIRFIGIGHHNFESTWLCCYPSPLAWIVTTMSAVVLPTIVAAWLAWDSWAGQIWGVTIAGFLLHIAACVWSFWGILQVSRLASNHFKADANDSTIYVTKT